MRTGFEMGGMDMRLPPAEKIVFDVPMWPKDPFIQDPQGRTLRKVAEASGGVVYDLVPCPQEEHDACSCARLAEGGSEAA